MNYSANSTLKGSDKRAADYFTTDEIIAGSVILVVMILSAFIGNVLTCLIIYKKPNFRTTTNISILFLSISDVLMATLVMPFSLASLVKRGWIFSSEACRLNGIIIIFLGGVSLVTMTCTAVIRYLRVVKSSFHQQYVKPKTVAVGIFTLWLLYAIGQAIFQFVTSANEVYSEIRLYCLPELDVKVLSEVINFTAIASLLILGSTISLAYFKVFRFVSQHNNNVAPTLQQEAKITKTLVIVVLGFWFCWVPVAVIYFVQSFVYSQSGQFRMPKFAILFQTICVFTSSAINPFIYGFTNKRFRKQYLELLGSLCPSSSQVAPVVNGSSLS